MIPKALTGCINGQYMIVREIGSGSYGRVFEGIDIYSGQVKDYFFDIFTE